MSSSKLIGVGLKKEPLTKYIIADKNIKKDRRYLPIMRNGRPFQILFEEKNPRLLKISKVYFFLFR